jgi:hypothetical protein
MEKGGFRSRMNIPDNFFESFLVKKLKFFDADPDLGFEIEKLGSRIRYNNPGSATLEKIERNPLLVLFPR